MSINKVMVSGNLGSDPEMRQTSGGMAVMTLRVAVSDYKRNKQTGQAEEYTNWIDCTMMGERAQKVAGYLSKGSKVCIAGKLRYSQWERDGQKRSKIGVLIDDIEFMSRNQQQYAQPAMQPQPMPAQPIPQAAQPMQQALDAMQQQMPQQAQQGGYYDSDIPF